jgi:hypothetical protein
MATYYWVGGNGTWDNSSTTNWATSSGGAGGSGPPLITDTVIFDANSGTAAIVSVASTARALLTTVDKSDITISLSASVTLSTGNFTLTSGILTLNNNKLTIGIFISNNSNSRTINFGTGDITVTSGSSSCIQLNTLTNLALTGTPVINSTFSGSTGTRTIRSGSTAGGSAATAVSLNVTAGTDAVSIGGHFNTVNYTGYAGTATTATAISLYGNLVVSSGMTFAASTNATSFLATSGTQQITTNGKTLDFPLTQNSPGATLQLQDNLTMGSTRTFTLTAGTLDLTGNSGNWTLSTGLFSSNNSNTRSIAFGTGNITVTGNGGTVLQVSTATGLTYTGTPTINFTYSGSTGTRNLRFGNGGGFTETNSPSINITAGTDIVSFEGGAKNFIFSGFAGTFSNNPRTIYGNFTLTSGITLTAGTSVTTFAGTSGTQQLTIAGLTLDFPLTFNGIGGTFAFQDALTQGSTRAFTITNGTVQLKNGVTSTVGAFATSGTNQKFLQSTLAGSQATLSQVSGTVNASYLTIQDINATGGATWNAFTTNNNVNAGNNLGWDFSSQLGKYIYTRRKNKRILP